MTSFVRVKIKRGDTILLDTVIPINEPGDLEKGLANEMSIWRLHNPGDELLANTVTIELSAE